MARMKRIHENPDTGWSDLILPVMKGYRMACCDCGLVHDLDFEVFRITGQDVSGVFLVAPMSDEEAQVAFRARRNNRSTAAKRRRHALVHGE